MTEGWFHTEDRPATDAFERPDSSTSVGGSGWVAQGGTWGIDTGRAYMVSTTGGAVEAANMYILRRDAGVSTGKFSVLNRRGNTSGASGLVFGQDPTARDGYILNFDGSGGLTILVRRINNGSPYQLPLASPTAANARAWGHGGLTSIGVDWDASTGVIDVYQDGVQFFSVTDASPFTTGTWCGFATNFPSSSHAGEFFNDFDIGSVGGFPELWCAA